jgi:hypothetical protein
MNRAAVMLWGYRGPGGSIARAACAIMRRPFPVILVTALGSAADLPAQYFGRNKVQYETFRFEVIRSPGFDLHYYPEESVAALDAVRMAERWNTRLADLFSRPLSARKSVILYADHPDFQQTNVVGGEIDQSTGGVTESLLDRVVMPLTGSYAENDHVLGHELVHVFQYDLAEKEAGGVVALGRLPLWVVEGMAEYLSVGRYDPHTTMWLRDAIGRNDLPTIKKLSDGRRYFPYRYGHAFWAFVGGRWGDDMVPRLFRASLREGFDDAVRGVLGMSVDSLSRLWTDATRAALAPTLTDRRAPGALGERAVFADRRAGEYHLSPAVSPDGRYVAFFTQRGVEGIQLVLADAGTGRILRTLAKPGISSHFDALSFLSAAAAWSPDGRKLAFVTFANGDNEIEILDVASRRVERRVRPLGVGAVTGVTWSPDGGQLALSGMRGGISDLYLFDLTTGQTRQLTDDRFADLQPAWSPDGGTIAFATDRAGIRGESGSDFGQLAYSPPRIALIDVATGSIRVLPGFDGAKHVNPQWTADGRSLYFVSDRGGVSDVYRVAVNSGELFEVTRVTTGVSGVTATSPALSVARQTGALLFSVFSNAGYHIVRLPADRADGVPVDQSRLAGIAAGVLPPASPAAGDAVGAYLRNPDQGLEASRQTQSFAYTANLKLAAVGQPSLGVTAGGRFGTLIGGSASAAFVDVLGNRTLGVALQASGTFKDIGGQLLYINTGRRWNWGASVERTPYLIGYTTVSPTSVVDASGQAYSATAVDYIIERLVATGGSLIAQYPLSSTRRYEFAVGYTHYGYSIESDRDTYVGGSVVANERIQIAAPTDLGLMQASLAYVGDASFFGTTSPIAGTRYRFSVSPVLGSLTFQTVLADVRQYFSRGPLTLAVRGVHYGRYGKDSDSERLGSLYLGSAGLVRGYAYDSFDGAECQAAPVDGGSLAGSSCPQFERLLGSRVAVANAEVRVPILGPHGYGLLPSPLPIELAPFLDAGAAWTGSSNAVWSFSRSSTERTPVVSTGLAARTNLFGFAVLELYYARPFQRPTRGGVFGIQLQPGW